MLSNRHLRRLVQNMEQLQQQKKKIIGIEPTAENDSVDMFEQAAVAAE